MLVLITQTRRFDLGTPLQLCEQHGREQAARLQARWPEPHEHGASTKLPNSRWTVTVRVLKDREGLCDHCQPERELSGAEVETVLAEAFEQRARSL